MSSSVYFIGVTWLVLILTIESVYLAYTYDDGISDDEHCCLVRLDDKFCLAKPLTGSLLQVNKQCDRLDANEDNKNYLNKIVRRLNVETSQKLGDKILLELKTPLEKDILKDDLLCLASANNNINLEKCYVELVDVEPKEQKRKDKHNSDRKKDAVVKNETTAEQAADDNTNSEEKDGAENKTSRFETTQPIQIREGHGLAIRQTYEVNLTNTPPKDRQKRQCWSWYRTHTKEIRQNLKKHKKSCIHLNNQREKCLEKLVYKQINEVQQTYSKLPITVGSKLYCQDVHNLNKLLGYHRRSEICFQTQNQIYIEHKFTDFVNLSDRNKNTDVLQFIANSTKLTSEFESDCNDKTTLVETVKSFEKEAEPIVVVESVPTEA